MAKKGQTFQTYTEELKLEVIFGTPKKKQSKLM